MKNKLLLLFTFLIIGLSGAFASCPGDTARFTTTAGVCNSTTITFTNTSVGASTYFWDFGDGTTLTDTSNLMSPPAYTYPSLGFYTATLIVDRYTPCADTFTVIVNMAYATAAFTTNAPTCVTTPVQFTDASVAGPGSTIINWHWDFGQSGNSDTSAIQNPSFTYNTGNQSYVAKVVVTTSDGCKDSTTSGIGLQSAVIVNAGANITSCDNNQTVSLAGSVTNAGGGVWTGTGSFSSATSLTATYTPTPEAKANGIDTLILTSFSSPYCPNVSDTVFITFNPGPTVSVGADITICKDATSIPVTATLTGATGGVWHTTSTEGTFTNDSLVTTFYHPSSSDTAAGTVVLYLETTGTGICSSVRDSLTIFFTPVPTVLIKTQDTSCSGAPIILSVVVSTGSGVWSTTGSGTFVPNNTSLANSTYLPDANELSAGQVILMFTSDNNGTCQPVTDTLLVHILPSPVAEYSYISACEDSLIQFTDNSSISSGSIIGWNWVFGDLSTPSFAPSPSHAYSNCGNKIATLIVTADNGCVDSKFHTVPVYCHPTASYIATGICLKNGTMFTNTSSVSGSSIGSSLWSFGDNTSSSETNPMHSFPSSGSFPVTLLVESIDGCPGVLTQTLTIDAGPVAAYTIDDETADIGQTITFTDQSNSVVEWAWNFGDGTGESSLTNPTHEFTVSGVYNVCLITTDGSGCTDTICAQEIVSTTPHAPQAFSPNGDGQNDIFFIYGGPFKKLELKVYDNWGKVIFTSDKQSLGWDGKFNNVDQPMGVYIYTVSGITEDDKEYKVSGDVTLMR